MSFTITSVSLLDLWLALGRAALVIAVNVILTVISSEGQ